MTFPLVDTVHREDSEHQAEDVDEEVSEEDINEDSQTQLAEEEMETLPQPLQHQPLETNEHRFLLKMKILW